MADREALTVKAALAKLDGAELCRCAYCGVWAEAGPYIIQLCEACGSWHAAWLRESGGPAASWRPSTEVVSEPHGSPYYENALDRKDAS